MAAKKEHKLTLFELTQELDPKHFRGLTDDEKKIIADGNADQIGRMIQTKLFAAGYVLKEYHCIIHDKDQRTVWDEHSKNYIIELKLRHFHLYGRFLSMDGTIYSGTLPQVAAVIGVEPQYIGKAPAGRYGWDNMLSYAIHAKDAQKYQYDPAEVASGGAVKKDDAGNPVPLWTPYQEIYRDRRYDWEKGRAKKTAKSAADDVDTLEAKILLGEVTRNQVLLTDAYYEIYARNKRRCDDAFDTYIQRKIARTMQAMESGEFRVSVYFVTGKSHSGKSFFTDALAARIRYDAKNQLGQDWSVCSCAASNPFDEYDGSEILVMDDLRGMALTASDWLKLMDPDRISMGSARYRNKRIAARCIIINSEKDVVEFFYYMKGNSGGDRSEAMDQFFRRIIARVVVYRVPDDVDTRRMMVGHMQEVKPGLLLKPGADGRSRDDYITVRHDFSKAPLDLAFDDALDHLSGMVMERNRGRGV